MISEGWSQALCKALTDSKSQQRVDFVRLLRLKRANETQATAHRPIDQIGLFKEAHLV